MRANELRNVITFTNSYGKGNPTKGEGIHKICAYTGSAHSCDDNIADITAWSDEVQRLADFQGICQLPGKAFNIFFGRRHKV